MNEGNETDSEKATNVVAIPLRSDAPEFQRLLKEVTDKGLLDTPPVPGPLLPEGLAERFAAAGKVRRESGGDPLTLGEFMNEEGNKPAI